MDMRGHGRSEGKTVLVPSLAAIAMDTANFHEAVRSLYTKHGKAVKYFVVAHSLGCM